MAVLHDFTARADLVGNRVQLLWEWRPHDGDDELGPLPPVQIRAKDLDFAFDELTDGGLLYDSTAFPPADAEVVATGPVALASVLDGDHRIDTTVVTVSRQRPDGGPVAAHPDLVDSPDAWVEIARLTVRTRLDAAGRVVAASQEILDAGGLTGLRSHLCRCYRLEVGGDGPGPRRADATAVPTRVHGHSRTLYQLLPTVWRRDDGPPPGRGPATDRIGAIPESRQDAGPLRRLVDVFGIATDHLRSRADGLRTLHDIEAVDPRHLPHLAHLMGWEIFADRPIAEQRHAIRYASRLYGLTGTVAGVQLWAKRLTGWDVELAELRENVLWTNDPGGEWSPTASGSGSLDTGDDEVMARLGRHDDQADYTYDTGTGPTARYSPHTIGLFPTVAEGTARDVVARNCDRLLAASDRFLPANLRLVVVLPDDPVDRGLDVPLGTSTTTDGVVP